MGPEEAQNEKKKVLSRTSMSLLLCYMLPDQVYRKPQRAVFSKQLWSEDWRGI
jgi:hypothetical protein